MSIHSGRSEVSTHHFNSHGPPLCEEDLRQQVQKLTERERRLMELLRTKSPEKIEHDLRNVLNELVLLRALFDPQSGD